MDSRIATLTEKRFFRRIYTFSEKALRINGPSHYPQSISPILMILGFYSRISFDFVT